MPSFMLSVRLAGMKQIASAMSLICVLGFSSAVLLADDAPKAEPVAGATESAPASDAKSEGADAKEHHSEAGHDDHGSHGGHVHDPLNLTELNQSKEIKEVASVKFQDSIASLAIFGLLFAILLKFAWGPITKGLDAREGSIADMIEQARIGAEKAAKQLQEYEAKLAVATEEARGIVAQARVDAEATKEKIIAEGKAVSQQERERAIADIQAAKSQALSEIARKSVDTAINLAKDIVKREVKAGDHEQLIGEAISQFNKSSLN